MQCYKEMYELANKNQASILFILSDIIKEGFNAAVQGYLQAKNMRMTVEMKSFHLDCEYFAKIGEQLSKIIFGNDDSLYLDWKDKQINFDGWMKKNIISNQFSVKR